MLLGHPTFEVSTDQPGLTLHEWDGRFLQTLDYLRLKDGIDPRMVVVASSFATAAIDSYRRFKYLEAEGKVGQRDFGGSSSSGSPIQIHGHPIRSAYG